MPDQIKSEEIDIAATIAALRAQAIARGKAMGLTEQASFDDPLRQASDAAHISAHFPIMWRVPIVGRMIALAQRAIRIGLRWYINPIVDQINDFNEATITALNTIVARQEALAVRIAALEAGDGPNPPPAQRAPGLPTGEEGAIATGPMNSPISEAPLPRTADGPGLGAAL